MTASLCHLPKNNITCFLWICYSSVFLNANPELHFQFWIGIHHCQVWRRYIFTILPHLHHNSNPQYMLCNPPPKKWKYYFYWWEIQIELIVSTKQWNGGVVPFLLDRGLIYGSGWKGVCLWHIFDRLKIKWQIIRKKGAIFPTPPKSYATIFFGVQRTLFWSN